MRRHIALVFAANTDCGKTLLSAGLVRAALKRNARTHYIKPVQTGSEFDAQSVLGRNQQYAAAGLQTSTLFHFNDPVSPHLAAAGSKLPIPSSFELRERLKRTIAEDARSEFFVVETAGGVLSPLPDETPTADALERFALKNDLPVHCLLVGDARLGGISATLAALEVLERRRFNLASLVLFCSDEDAARLGNQAYLEKRLQRDPIVRRVSLAAGREAALPMEYFDQQVFDDIYQDLVQAEEHDRRALKE